ncbi:hypothetical protein MIMGU_mgv1a022230mg [Erythranthe guttata]|uniref:Disease resistance R13L4/SHOC-2-like LRR domain-containing protein n=1 Tax=Erythranthe guttata TaxID=4155 RepID=A0A022RWX5_ERYGU|nr:hypothetical protein MIMGU_mgv1a022230mg [Erythranthe guttata]
MKLLDSKESWKLLMKKAFIDNNEGKCPEDLYDIGRDVLRKRDGLPLAIFVGGGLLVDRIPSKSKWENVSKKINSHLGTRESSLSIRKAKEEISFEIRREDGNSQSLDKPRHRAVYCSTETFIYSAGKNKYLRSLFFHGSGNDIDVKPSYWKSFELLKILNFEDFILNELPYTIGELTGLRYLRLRNTKILEPPRLLGRLKNLEVLDVAKNYIYVRNVSACKNRNLHTLSYIRTDHFVLKHLTQLASLRTLGIDLRSSDFEFSTLCSSLKNLVCLKVRNIDMYPTSMDVLDTMCNRTKLKLEGKLTKLPDLPPNLSYLTLVHGELLHDPMPVLEKLPKLLGLKLDYAYKGQKMEVSKKGFPRLKVLILREMWYLETIQVGKGGGMPELKGLEIYACFRLMEGLSKEMRLITILLEE